jgi:hypothetical protein
MFKSIGDDEVLEFLRENFRENFRDFFFFWTVGDFIEKGTKKRIFFSLFFSLIITDNAIKDEGATAIARAIKENTTITELDLSSRFFFRLLADMNREPYRRRRDGCPCRSVKGKQKHY